MKLSNIFNRRNRILLAELIRTDFKLRYQDSALGYLWSVLNPLMLFAILYVVFSMFLGVGKGIDHYPVYLLVGIVLWRFFAEATNNGLKSIVSRGNLIRKINFPKYIIVISGTISSLINLGLNMIVALVFILFSGISLDWNALLAIPLILELYILALALSFFLSALNVRLRDIGYLWDVILQAAFYATPIIYPISIILSKSEIGAQILMSSPVAQVIQDVRRVLVTNESISIYQVFGTNIAYAIPLTIITVIGLGSAFYFKKHSKKFAEDV